MHLKDLGMYIVFTNSTHNKYFFRGHVYHSLWHGKSYGEIEMYISIANLGNFDQLFLGNNYILLEGKNNLMILY